jgi:hypothetical protein
MAIEILTTNLKNKTWTTLKIKNHKISHEHRLIRPQTQHKSSEHVCLKFLKPSVEKIVKLYGFKLQHTQLFNRFACPISGNLSVLSGGIVLL